MKTLEVHTLEDWSLIATEVIAMATAMREGGAAVVTLEGDLGAGKTTLVQSIAKSLGVTDVVTSPTFTIMRRYELPPESEFAHLVHIDAYRIDNPAEMNVLHFSDILQETDTLVCIEWPTRVATLLPTAVIEVAITTAVEHETRTVTIHA